MLRQCVSKRLVEIPPAGADAQGHSASPNGGARPRHDGGPLHVLALMTDAFGGYGGIAQYNRDLVSALSHRHDIKFIDVHVRVAPLSLEPLPAKARQHRALKSPPRYALAAALNCLQRAPDLIFNGHLFHGPLALHLKRVTGARLISQLHGTEVWTHLPRKHLQPLALSDLVLCVSNDTKSRFLSQAPHLQGRAAVVPNMVGEAFRPGDRDAARRALGFGAEKIILTVARLDDRGGYKGHDRIIRLLPRLLEAHAGGVRYVIAGEGPDRSRLETLAAALGVSNAVLFLGRVPTEELPRLYRASDIFAMPSTGEGFGIVYLEAMACGTPALGIDAGGVCDAFANGALGVCPKSEAFEDVLAAMLAAPKPDPEHLSSAVFERFGAQAFATHLDAALATLFNGVSDARLRQRRVEAQDTHVRH